jgi:hypothetical protein
MVEIFHSGSDRRAAGDRHRFQAADSLYGPLPDGKVRCRVECVECVDLSLNEPVEW